MEISLNKNFVNKVDELYFDASSKTSLPDSNVFINAEKFWGNRGSKKIIEAFPETKTDIATIRKELEVKIDTKPIYNLTGVDYDIQEKTISSYDGKDVSIEEESSSAFNVPINNNTNISFCRWTNENLEVCYIDSCSRKVFQTTYSAHSLKHGGDKRILFQAMSIGINDSFVITDEYEKENKKNLGYDLRINGITNYSMHHVLPIMVVKNIITREEMLRTSKKLSTCTNRSVDEKFLIESLKNLDKL